MGAGSASTTLALGPLRRRGRWGQSTRGPGSCLPPVSHTLACTTQSPHTQAQDQVRNTKI